MLAGDTERVKPEAAVTVRPSANVLTILPDLPEMVTVALPGTAELDADKVRVVELKDAVTPAAKPEALRATVPEKPFSGVTAMVLVTLAPGVTDRTAGVDAMLKEGVACVAVS